MRKSIKFSFVNLKSSPHPTWMVMNVSRDQVYIVRPGWGLKDPMGQWVSINNIT